MSILFYVNLVSTITNAGLAVISIRYYLSKGSIKNYYLLFMMASAFIWNMNVFFGIFNVPSDRYLIPIFFILFQTIPVFMISYGLNLKSMYISESIFFVIGMIASVFLTFSSIFYVVIGILLTFNVIFSITFMIAKYSNLISFTKRSKILSYMIFYGFFAVLETVITWLWIYKNSMWSYIEIMNSVLIPLYLYIVVNLVYEKHMTKISMLFLKNVLYGAIISALISSILMISYYTNFYFSKTSAAIQFFSMIFVIVFFSFLVFGNYLQKIDVFFERHLRIGHEYKREKMKDFVASIYEIDSLEKLNDLIVNYCTNVLNTNDVELFFKDISNNYTSILRGIKLNENDLPNGEPEKIIDLYYANLKIFPGKELFVWLKNSDKIEGFMVLGHKKNGRYSSEDLEWIEVLSNHIAFFLSRYRSIQRVIKVEKAMMFQERMASIGKLSSEVAHEIRNPLNVISTSLQMIRKSSDREENQKLWRYIEEELDRVNSILENFLYFSRQKSPILEEDDPSNVVKKVSLLLNEVALKKSVEIKLSLPDTPFNAKFDKTMLTEILLNIGTNALESVESGNWIKFKVEDLGHIFKISVSNNGKPIPQSEIQHIFEPFYTTKENGTGLGLSIVYNYVNAMNGNIEVKSDEEETIFSIEIPKGVKV